MSYLGTYVAVRRHAAVSAPTHMMLRVVARCMVVLSRCPPAAVRAELEGIRDAYRDELRVREALAVPHA